MQHLVSNTRLSVLLSGLLLSGVVSAAPQECRQLAEDACATESSCTWVQGYVRKDGREVSAYCRNAPVKTEARQSGLKLPEEGKGQG